MVFYVINGTRVHMKIAGRKAAPPCRAVVERQGIVCHCQGISSALCDWPARLGLTCSMPMCAEHAHQVGKDRHYCERHLAMHMHRANEPELF